MPNTSTLPETVLLADTVFDADPTSASLADTVSFPVMRSLEETVPFADTASFPDIVPFAETDPFPDTVPFADTDPFPDTVLFEDTDPFPDTVPFADTDPFPDTVCSLLCILLIKRSNSSLSSASSRISARIWTTRACASSFRTIIWASSSSSCSLASCLLVSYIS